MGVVKNKKNKTKNDDVKTDVVNGKNKRDDGKVKKKKKVSCLQCFKSPDDGGVEGKYRVAAPELMQDTFMSDSEDEGGEVECPIQQQQQYRYMNSEVGTLNRARPLEDSVTDGHLWPSNNDSRVATIERQPVDIGFLVSFVVDARGGAMKAKRRGGVRIIVPPAACAAPTRVTCRAATRRAPAAAPPPLMEGEALASRLLELQPQGAKFLAPVIIEVPIFTASCPEREIVILRSDTGETWQDHYLHNNDNPMIQETLTRERQEHGNSGESLGESGERVTRIITCDFPHYLAVVSRVRQEVHIIGPEGGTISSAHIPQVQALFPPQALTKRIRVGLQAHGATPALARRVLPRHAAVSPVLTVEPRRRKFHRSITLTAPLPHAPDQKVNSHDKQSTANLRLLCSIMGGQARAVWEDVTGSTPLTITDDCASFTTTVSARFWLMNCQNVSDATKLATELYREMLLVPFEVRIVVLGKRLDALEGRLLVLYITDRYAYDTLLHQEHYTEVAHSTAVKFLDGKPIYLEFSGNLVPVTKSGTQPTFTFEAFKDNRVEFTVRVKHHEENPSGRIYFMNEPKAAKGEQAASPACVLDVSLPERIAPRAAKSHLDCLNLDQSGFDALKDELSFHWSDHNHSVGPPPIPQDQPALQLNGHDKTIANGDVKYTTKETDKDDKTHVNGDTLHVDSNKTKATFDSDEDKTPMNTLEKGKKKSEGGSFFGDLAGKVKNVFGHSEDKEDSKESSPKPQPKPRESKEKTPPKPAPRLITEDLLEKVDDMFKDVHSKRHLKDEDDVDSKVYATKLIVDEETPSDIKNKTEELYLQYEHMQPVETPLIYKKSDPFQFPDCCEGKFKHRHNETSNLTDRIEQVKFAAHEKLHEVSEGAENNSKEALDKVKKEQENILQQANEVTEDILVKSENIKNDLIKKKEDLKSNIEDNVQIANNKFDDIKKPVEKVKEDAYSNAVGIKSEVNSSVENIKSSANNVVNNLAENANNAQEKIKGKAHEVDFAAMEIAEEMKLRGHDKLSMLGKTFEETTNDISHKTKDGTNAVTEKINDIKDSLDKTSHNIQTDTAHKAENVKETAINVQNNIINKANNVKKGTKDTIDDLKDATKENVDEINESIDVAKNKGQEVAADVKSKAKDKKDKVKSEAKKKSKEGKNFFTGLVHNIFGEKDKIENEVIEKVADTKDSVTGLANKASEAKENVENNITKEEEKIIKDAEVIVQSAKVKTDELLEKAKETKEKTVNNVQEKTNHLADDIENKTKDAIKVAQDKANNTVESLHDKKDEVVHDAQEISENVLKNVHDKADKLVKNIDDKKDEALQFVQDAKNNIVDTVVNTKQEVYQSADEKLDELLKVGLKKKDNITGNLQNKSNEIKENLQEKKNTLDDAIITKKDEIVKTFNDNTELVKQELGQSKAAVEAAIIEKKDDVIDAKNALQESASDRLNRIRQEAEQTTEEIKRSAEEVLNAAAEKKSHAENVVADKFSELKKSGEEKLITLDQAAKDKGKEIQKSAKVTFGQVQESASSAIDDIECTAKDKMNSSKEAYEDVQSSARDTFADLKDDVHGLESSTQDTLHSFQSSAGNTFESLDESVREYVGGVQHTASNAEDSAKELFGNVKDTFEGFQVAAGDKLEDIKGTANDSLQEVDDRLQNTKEGIKEGAKGTDEYVADTLSSEADKFTSSLNDLGNSVFGMSGKGFMKDSSSKLLESEKSQSSPHKKSSGIPKLKRKNKK